MASAQTGSGKTVMFALPMLQRLLASSSPKRRETSSPAGRSTEAARSAVNPRALVLSPTRELAAQIANAARQLAPEHETGLRVGLATGGEASRAQRLELAKGCDVLVGTPGRVQQFVDERFVQLRACEQVVVDEADRMLDLGFEPQVFFVGFY